MKKTIYKVGIKEAFDLAGGTNWEEDCAGYFFNRDDAWEKLMEEFAALCTKADTEYGDVYEEGKFWKRVDKELGIAIYEGCDALGEKWTKTAWLEEIKVR